MTRKLEELFDLPPSASSAEESQPTSQETKAAIVAIDETIDKIDSALPAVRDLDSSDKELDHLAEKATEVFENLTDLGFNVDSRYAAELFAVAGTMLGHALTAKTTKLQKKLKVLDLQMKKMKLDHDVAKNKGEDPDMIPGEGQILNSLSRNELLEKLIGNRDQKSKDA